jgi:carbon monoxide dehydrogenase subunit G
MRLTNEFDVGLTPARTWETLLDVPRVARALPGASIDDAAGARAWRGTMRVKLGPVITEYAGTARVQDIDEDDRVVSYRVEGREARGQGTAAATITTRLQPHQNDGTRVVVETELHLTGRQAQLGRNLMEDVAGAILGEFAGRLERELSGETVHEDDAVDELDVSRAVRGAVAERAAMFGAGVLAGAVLGFLAGRALRA